MSIFQHISRVTTIGAVIVLFAPSFAAAEQGGRYWVPLLPPWPAQPTL